MRACRGPWLLWFDHAATGSILRLPFSLFSPTDSLGFGNHRLHPQEPAHHFGLAQGWQGLAEHLRLLGTGWAFGGIVVVGWAVIAFRWRVVPPAALAVLSGGLLLTCGYLFFWGTWNAAVGWGAVRYLGPYYLTPLLLPLCIIAAIGIRHLAVSRGFSRLQASPSC